MSKFRWSRLYAVMALAAVGACGGDAGDTGDTGAVDDTSSDAAVPAETGGTAFGANVQYPEGVTAEMASAGQQLFNSSVCTTCHGVNGVGGPLAPALNDETWINVDGSYDQIVQVITTGVPTPKEHPAAMPAMGGAQLSEEQVRELAAYVFALSHGG